MSDVFLPKGSMNARYEPLSAPADSNGRVLDGATEQILCEDTDEFHTIKVAMIDGAAALVVDQEGMPR